MAYVESLLRKQVKACESQLNYWRYGNPEKQYQALMELHQAEERLDSWLGEPDAPEWQDAWLEELID